MKEGKLKTLKYYAMSCFWILKLIMLRTSESKSSSQRIQMTLFKALEEQFPRNIFPLNTLPNLKILYPIWKGFRPSYTKPPGSQATNQVLRCYLSHLQLLILFPGETKTNLKPISSGVTLRGNLTNQITSRFLVSEWVCIY